MISLDELEARIEDLRAQLHRVAKGDGLKIKAAGFRLGSMQVYEVLAGILQCSGLIRLHYGTNAERSASTDYEDGVAWWTSDTHNLYVGNGSAWQLIGGASGAAPAAHASTHQHSGADETATATPGANKIVKAEADGKIAAGWIDDGDISHDSIAGVSVDDHHAQSHNVASHNDTTATGTELETLTDGSDADALHDHATLATAAEAVAAVEAADPLDMANAIQVDTINEHTATAGLTIDLLTLIKDGKVTPDTTYSDAFLYSNAAATSVGLDANDYFLFAKATDLWQIFIDSDWRFKVSDTAADFNVPLDMNSNKITALTAGSASGEAVEYDQLHAEAHSVASHDDTTATGTELETLTDASDASSLHVHKKTVIFKVLAHDTALSTGDNKEEWTVPLALNGWNLTDADAAVYTASSAGGNGAVGPIQIYNETQTADMLSTGITLDQDEFNSYTANTQPVIDTGEDDVATGDILSFDVDTAAGTGTKGLDIIMVFTKP